MKIDKILRTAMEYGASDIYITTGTKPILRINGSLMAIGEHPELTNEAAEGYIFEMMNENHKNTLAKEKEADFSVEITGVALLLLQVLIQVSRQLCKTSTLTIQGT